MFDSRAFEPHLPIDPQTLGSRQGLRGIQGVRSLELRFPPPFCGHDVSAETFSRNHSNFTFHRIIDRAIELMGEVIKRANPLNSGGWFFKGSDHLNLIATDNK